MFDMNRQVININFTASGVDQTDRALGDSKNCLAATKKGHFTKVCKLPVAVVRKLVPELAVLYGNDVKLIAEAFDKITCQMNSEAPRGTLRSWSYF